jgi:dynein intermediate chain 1
MYRISINPNPFRHSAPSMQLQLNETEMKEEVTRVLTANDPHVPNNITKYNFKERTYKVDPPGQGDLLAIHFSYDGCALHKVRFIFSGP